MRGPSLSTVKNQSAAASNGRAAERSQLSIAPFLEYLDSRLQRFRGANPRDFAKLTELIAEGNSTKLSDFFTSSRLIKDMAIEVREGCAGVPVGFAQFFKDVVFESVVRMGRASSKLASGLVAYYIAATNHVVSALYSATKDRRNKAIDLDRGLKQFIQSMLTLYRTNVVPIVGLTAAIQDTAESIVGMSSENGFSFADLLNQELDTDVRLAYRVHRQSCAKVQAILAGNSGENAVLLYHRDDQGWDQLRKAIANFYISLHTISVGYANGTDYGQITVAVADAYKSFFASNSRFLFDKLRETAAEIVQDGEECSPMEIVGPFFEDLTARELFDRSVVSDGLLYFLEQIQPQVGCLMMNAPDHVGELFSYFYFSLLGFLVTKKIGQIEEWKHARRLEMRQDISLQMQRRVSLEDPPRVRSLPNINQLPQKTISSTDVAGRNILHATQTFGQLQNAALLQMVNRIDRHISQVNQRCDERSVRGKPAVALTVLAFVFCFTVIAPIIWAIFRVRHNVVMKKRREQWAQTRTDIVRKIKSAKTAITGNGILSAVKTPIDAMLRQDGGAFSQNRYAMFSRKPAKSRNVIEANVRNECVAVCS